MLHIEEFRRVPHRVPLRYPMAHPVARTRRLGYTNFNFTYAVLPDRVPQSPELVPEFFVPGIRRSLMAFLCYCDDFEGVQLLQYEPKERLT